MESVSVPVFILLAIGGAVSASAVVVWRYLMYLVRENRRLNDLLLREKEEKVRILDGLRREAERRGKGYESNL